MSVGGVDHRKTTPVYETNSGSNRLHVTDIFSGNGAVVLQHDIDQMLKGNRFKVKGTVELAAAGTSVFGFYSSKPLQLVASVVGTKESKFALYEQSSIDVNSTGTAVVPVNMSAVNCIASVNSFRPVGLKANGSTLHSNWKAAGGQMGFTDPIKTSSGYEYGIIMTSVVASNVIDYEFKWTE